MQTVVRFVGTICEQFWLAQKTKTDICCSINMQLRGYRIGHKQIIAPRGFKI